MSIGNAQGFGAGVCEARWEASDQASTNIKQRAVDSALFSGGKRLIQYFFPSLRVLDLF